MASIDEQIQERTAEALEKDGAIAAPKKARRSRKGKPVAEAPAPAPSTVYVFANLPSGQKFKLPSGRTVAIDGMPVSVLKKPGGGSFPGGKYGITQVDADAWNQVMKHYGRMAIFRSGLVFSARSLEDGKAMARERGGLRHGQEPIDPYSRKKTKPKED